MGRTNGNCRCRDCRNPNCPHKRQTTEQIPRSTSGGRLEGLLHPFNQRRYCDPNDPNCRYRSSPSTSSTPIYRPKDPTPIKRPPQEVTIDYEKVSELVIQKMKQNPEPFKGEKAVSPTISYDKLATAVADRLPGIDVVFKGKGGTRTQVKLGGKLEIPAVVMDIYPNVDSDEGRERRETALGEAIKIEEYYD